MKGVMKFVVRGHMVGEELLTTPSRADVHVHSELSDFGRSYQTVASLSFALHPETAVFTSLLGTDRDHRIYFGLGRFHGTPRSRWDPGRRPPGGRTLKKQALKRI